MQTWEAITSRRNVRSFSEQPIGSEDLHRILEAGRRAPSSRNLQPWDFVVVTERAQLQELSKVWVGAGHVAGAATAIALIIGPAEEPGHRDEFDLGQATMAMMVVAADAGIGSAHSAVGDQDLARQVLGLPGDRACAYLISLGYPADRPLAPIVKPNRRPFDEIVHWDHW